MLNQNDVTQLPECKLSIQTMNAAPELLDACKFAKQYLETVLNVNRSTHPMVFDVLENAIKKAEDL